MYPTFWRFATYFTGLWVAYGCFLFIRDLVVHHEFHAQPLYLILGMSILFYESKRSYSSK